jgi:thiol-disulfide isomerase/thioredoxin
MYDSIFVNFDESFSEEEKIIVTVFFASYCPFCVRFSPIFEKRARQAKYVFAKADITDDDNPFWNRYNIKVVPTLIAFKDGEEIMRKDGILGVGLDEHDLSTFLHTLQQIFS